MRALCAQTGYFNGRFFTCLQFLQAGIGFLETLESFLRRFEGFGRKVHGRAVMRLEDEETDDHRSERFREQGVLAFEELLERDEVIITLTHLLARDRDHVIMHPVMDGLVSQRRAALCYLRLVVGEDEVESTSVDIELLAEVFGTHRGALHMPSGESFGPGARPMHDMLGSGFFPQGEVVGVFLLILSVQFAGLGDDIVEVPSGELAVRVVLGVFLHIHIDGAVGHVRVAFIEDALHERDLLDDMSRRVGFNRRR